MSSPPSSSDQRQASTAFGRLHPQVQRWVWNQGWAQLRDVQERAAHEIFDGTGDLIIAAATAGGKTEAAFLPIASVLVGHKADSIQVLCVSPLKALINDQYDRLDRLFEHVEIPVHRWHGDVDGRLKHRVLREPSGVLLITPESLEAMFVLRGSQAAVVFAGLRYVVVDELHSFIGCERGRQLQSLLHRLELVLRRHVRRIGLSATIGDMDLAAQFLRPGAAERVTVLESSDDDQEIRLQLRGYETPARSQLPAGGAIAREAQGDSEDIRSITMHLFKVLRGTNNLVFANSRMDVEVFADRLRAESERQRVPNEFWPHHGSLAKALRQDVEAMLKDGTRPTTAVCTSTLEMGIDIGSMASTAQIGPPPTVASLRQRLGRSGRRREPAVIRLYVQEEELTPECAPQDALRLQLVESIAMVELLLRPWYEPPAMGQLHLSTLVQQVMSLIAQCGGVRAGEAWSALCSSGPFAGIERSMFADLLRGLGSHDLISQAADGTLLLGVAGERIVNRYDFYAAFVSPEEYRIVFQGQSLGSLPISHPIVENMPLIFAGRRWRVAAFDREQKVIEVVPAHAGLPPRFCGHRGLVHDEIRRQMVRVLEGADVPRYLDSKARTLLTQGRDNYRRLDLSNRRVVAAGSLVHLFPWIGDRATDTIAVQLQALDFDAHAAAGVISIANPDRLALVATLRRLAEAGPLDATTLAATVRNKQVEKYDGVLPEALLCVDYGCRSFDVEGAWKSLADIVASMPEGVPLAPPATEA